MKKAMTKPIIPAAAAPLSTHPVLMRIDAKAQELAIQEMETLKGQLTVVLQTLGQSQVQGNPPEHYIQLHPSSVFGEGSWAWGTKALKVYQKTRMEFHRARLSEDLLKQFTIV